MRFLPTSVDDVFLVEPDPAFDEELGKLTATMSKSAPSGYTLTASVSPPMSWLTVTPGGGTSPLALTVTVNPTGLSPGSYSGVITLGTSPGTSTTLVPVTLSISNPMRFDSDATSAFANTPSPLKFRLRISRQRPRPRRRSSAFTPRCWRW